MNKMWEFIHRIFLSFKSFSFPFYILYRKIIFMVLLIIYITMLYNIYIYINTLLKYYIKKFSTLQLWNFICVLRVELKYGFHEVVIFISIIYWWKLKRIFFILSEWKNYRPVIEPKTSAEICHHSAKYAILSDAGGHNWHKQAVTNNIQFALTRCSTDESLVKVTSLTMDM